MVALEKDTKSVLILILLEVTQMVNGVDINKTEYRLNPYSTGSNSNFNDKPVSQIPPQVLILILLEVTQIQLLKLWNLFM